MNKERFIFGVSLVVVSFIYSGIYFSKQCVTTFSKDTTTLEPKRLDGLISELIMQRNNVSKQLNLKQQMIGQQECEKIGQSKQTVSKTGGWCASQSYEKGGQHLTDTKLIPVFAEFFSGKYVASFGDGPGRYKQMLLATGKLKGYDAYDGAPFSEATSEGRVKFLDLTLPQYGLPLYDWIISLEVAEHIPVAFEAFFIDNIIRHAKEGVVLSWARPGQGGFSHVNNKPFEYVKNLFANLGFDHDSTTSTKFKEAASFDWLRHNTNVYRRRNLQETENLLFISST